MQPSNVELTRPAINQNLEPMVIEEANEDIDIGSDEEDTNQREDDKADPHSFDIIKAAS